MLPMKYRQRQVEQILFRNASISPQYFTLEIKTKELEIVSVVTVEPSIVSISGVFTFLESVFFEDDGPRLLEATLQSMRDQSRYRTTSHRLGRACLPAKHRPQWHLVHRRQPLRNAVVQLFDCYLQDTIGRQPEARILRFTGGLPTFAAEKDSNVLAGAGLYPAPTHQSKKSNQYSAGVRTSCWFSREGGKEQSSQAWDESNKSLSSQNYWRGRQWLAAPAKD